MKKFSLLIVLFCLLVSWNSVFATSPTIRFNLYEDVNRNTVVDSGESLYKNSFSFRWQGGHYVNSQCVYNHVNNNYSIITLTGPSFSIDAAYPCQWFTFLDDTYNPGFDYFVNPVSNVTINAAFAPFSNHQYLPLIAN